MFVKDLSGKQHFLNLSKYLPKSNDERPRSQLHLKARALLKLQFSMYLIAEEVPIPGESLYIDFYICNKNLAIEVHGEQHYKFNPHFFNDKLAYYKSQNRDLKKEQWCNLNKIRLVVFPYDRQKEWGAILTS